MIPELPLLPTLAAAAVASTLLSAVLSWVAVRDHADVTDPRAAEEGDVVRCSDCGAENEAGYRYCRACVSLLPGGAALQRHDSSPPERLVR